MKKVKTKDFDKKFDDNQNVSAFIGWKNAKKLDGSQMQVLVDFPKMDGSILG